VRILVVGAGLVGSVYAGQLARCGHEVALLARGGRLAELRRTGLRLRIRHGTAVTVGLTVAGEAPASRPDLIMIAVRREQAMAAAEQVGRIAAGTVLLFGNYAGMTVDLAAVCGRERTAAGFPGVGGQIDGGQVTYTRIAQQPTVVGTAGCAPDAVRMIAAALRGASFPTRFEPDIEGWLATHAALVVPMAAAIRAAGGSADALAGRRDLLLLAVRATRATYRTQRRMGRLVASRNLRLLYLLMPERFACWYWSRALPGDFGELAFAAHTRHAWHEMAMLGAWLRSTVEAEDDAARLLDALLGLAGRA
jgi:2-dehydropantoate 2-reductase